MYIKAITTGNVIEIYEYSQLNLNGNSGGNIGEHLEETKDENYWRTIKARRDNVRRLVTQNFDVKNSKFVTLTFNNKCKFDIKSPLECDRAFKTFIQRLKYYLEKKGALEPLKYVSVLEFQDKNNRGAVHYHMICNLPYIKNKQLERIWANGFIKINAIDKVDNIGAYVVKYMTKDNVDNRLKGCKGYLRSNNLEEPRIFKNWEKCEREYIASILASVENEKAVYTTTYHDLNNNENIINYKQYNLSRKENATKKNAITLLNELFGVGNWKLLEG